MIYNLPISYGNCDKAQIHDDANAIDSAIEGINAQ
jgi:hypothetical protein